MWKEGQRLFSHAEPELGLGVVTEISHKRGIIRVSFTQSGSTRQYSLKNAPVKAYSEGGEEKPYAAALETFFDGRLGNFTAFSLRKKAWLLKSESLAAQGKGLIGVRAHPIPHQLYIASETASRLRPRVLLADEVGLGKTIEAGLIFSRLKALGRAERVLILSPQPLVNQWMAELFRRFGALFSIYDEQRCSEEDAVSGGNAFEAQQWIITSLDFLKSYRERFEQVLEVSWDLVIVDEAHKLEWDSEDPSMEWLMAKSLSQQTHGLLLLTATPNQRGTSTLFGLLNLLDGLKYCSYESFIADSMQMADINAIVEAIRNDERKLVSKLIAKHFSGDSHLAGELAKYQQGGEAKALISSLIDRHGIGRVYFRNRRETIKGFPTRILHSVPLKASKVYREHLKGIDYATLSGRLLMDYATGRGLSRSFDASPPDDPRFVWLQEFFSKFQEKLLIICASQKRVEKLARFLDPNYKRASLRKVGVFHEGLSIVERDTQAAWFARDEKAKALVCSEIGGEGRNFQFVKTLLLFDLPMHPDLLEQRIGRLDRIGQGKTIDIIVPWIEDSPEEVLFKWYHEGLNAFCKSWNGASLLLEEFGEDILSLCAQFFPSHEAFSSRCDALQELIANTKTSVTAVRLEVADQIDSLVDLHSFAPSEANKLVEHVHDMDDDARAEFCIRDIMDYFGVDYEEYDNRGSVLVKANSLSFMEDFPLVADDDEDLLFTFNRRVALDREDIRFLTLDHPLVEATIDRIIYRNEGIASACRWDHSGLGRGAYLQLLILLEAKGPKRLDLNRFLPLKTREVILNHKGQRLKDITPFVEGERYFRAIEDPSIKLGISQLRKSLAEPLARLGSLAETWAQKEIASAIASASQKLGAEIERARFLANLHGLSQAPYTAELESLCEQTLSHLRSANVRIDSVRLILSS